MSFLYNFTTVNSSKADVSSVSPSSDRTSLLGQFTSSTQLIMIPPPPHPLTDTAPEFFRNVCLFPPLIESLDLGSSYFHQTCYFSGPDCSKPRFTQCGVSVNISFSFIALQRDFFFRIFLRLVSSQNLNIIRTLLREKLKPRLRLILD